MRVAHFTAGTVGVGHFIKAYAIRRALLRAGFNGTYRLFGPEWAYPCTRGLEWYEPVRIDGPAQISPETAAGTALTRRLLEYQPDLIIAELFWAPLHHILQLFDCPAWLILRKCVDRFLIGTPETHYDPARWDRIIAVEPVEYPSITHRIDPIVICNPDECRPPGALRERLGVSPGRTLAVVAHTGPAAEQEALTAIGEDDVHVVHFDLTHADAIFPLAEWLGGADVIMTGAGYNTYWESKWLGFYDRCSFTPFSRHIDDQAWRVRACADYWPKQNGADQLARWILDGR